jgi:hypothetical protein
MVLTSADGQLSGSVSNPALGIITPITDGTVAGDHITGTMMLTTPLQVTID